MIVKRCPSCDQTLSPGAFGTLKSSKDGLYPYCKTCARTKRREYWKKNKESCMSQNREWVLKNRDRVRSSMNEYMRIKRGVESLFKERKIRVTFGPYEDERAQSISASRKKHRANGGAEKDREWRLANPEKKKEYETKWRKNNPEKLREKYTRRYHRKRSNWVEDVDIDVLIANCHGLCGICGDSVSFGEESIDHIVPVAKGGEHSYDNVQISHLLCNSRKQDREICIIGGRT